MNVDKLANGNGSSLALALLREGEAPAPSAPVTVVANVDRHAGGLQRAAAAEVPPNGGRAGDLAAPPLPEPEEGARPQAELLPATPFRDRLKRTAGKVEDVATAADLGPGWKRNAIASAAGSVTAKAGAPLWGGALAGAAAGLAAYAAPVVRAKGAPDAGTALGYAVVGALSGVVGHLFGTVPVLGTLNIGIGATAAGALLLDE